MNMLLWNVDFHFRHSLSAGGSLLGAPAGSPMFFPELLNGWKKYATPLPKKWLAETPQTLASRK
ncbi:hypothetical protein, partial [Peribacillus frigoritolerans]|uniref:hypothetical protein n=1 Tax=Peribacillus frigoritolerans TaxID=450367 RepID=UPI00227DADC1